MNRKNLTAAVLAGLAGAAGIAGSAQAVNLNPDGLGQVLLYPYYTSNDGNDTLLSVVNTADSAKAVKVRFKEGFNSREVLDFNMYMSAFDVWVAAIVDDGGTPTLQVPDSTCTVPYIFGDFGGVQPFLPFDYTGSREDGGPTDISRAAEGHFEVIEMGTLTNDEEDSADAATHVFGPVEFDEDGDPVGPSVQHPADCQQLVDAWTAFADGSLGYWLEDPDTDMTRNSGGLFGGAAIINVAKGTLHSYNARAIQGYDKAATGNHFEPGTSNPSLNDGDQATATVFFGPPQDAAIAFSYARGVDAVSAVFMHEFIMNEYNIETNLNAASEWIVTFPTKNFYVDPGTEGAVGAVEIWQPDQDDIGCGGWTPGEPFPARTGPFFTDSLDQTDNNSNGVPDTQEDWVLCTFVDVGNVFGNRPFTSVFDGEACELAGLRLWDREENAGPDTPGSNRPPIVSPAPPPGDDPEEPDFELCFEVNVLRFGEVPVFGTTSDLLLNVDTGGRQSGWGRINLAEDTDHVDFEGLVGLPVTGFWAVQFENGFLGTPEMSVLSNYGGIFDHRANVRRTGIRTSD